jgi:hypothetical protein
VVRGTATGRLYGAPATKRSFEANFFDYVKVDNGLVVERIQQADVVSQMRQLYGKAVGLVGAWGDVLAAISLDRNSYPVEITGGQNFGEGQSTHWP